MLPEFPPEMPPAVVSGVPPLAELESHVLQPVVDALHLRKKIEVFGEEQKTLTKSSFSQRGRTRHTPLSEVSECASDSKKTLLPSLTCHLGQLPTDNRVLHELLPGNRPMRTRHLARSYKKQKYQQRHCNIPAKSGPTPKSGSLVREVPRAVASQEDKQGFNS